MGLASGGKGSEAELLKQRERRSPPASGRGLWGTARVPGEPATRAAATWRVGRLPQSWHERLMLRGEAVPLQEPQYHFPVLPADLHPSLLCYLLRPLV